MNPCNMKLSEEEIDVLIDTLLEKTKALQVLKTWDDISTGRKEYRLTRIYLILEKLEEMRNVK